MENKNKNAILSKLKINQLNPMQEEASLAIYSAKDVFILSPTGSGKTLAFLLPLISLLDKNENQLQSLILVPTRELAIQIEQVIREMGSGYKANAFYGGRAFTKDRQDLNHTPSILIGTPGRIADHIRRNTIDVSNLKSLVLDEFDKSLEIGFEDEMSEIIKATNANKKTVLTSATQADHLPSFIKIQEPIIVDYTNEKVEDLKILTVQSPSKDKLETLFHTLCHLGNQPGIIFCNYKDSIQRISEYLEDKGISHANFYGGLEQQDRERALIKFRNGTHQLLLATDLAARGIDIPEIKFIIHYHLPHSKEEFIHRNGRTARMHASGTAYLLKGMDEILPDYIDQEHYQKIKEQAVPSPSPWTTLFISGGRKDKISKGDIAGTFIKQGNIQNDELGVIELKQDCAFVSVAKDKADHIIQTLNNTRIKKKKVRIREI
jgi:superfamily II DNA/RNA helicase